MTNIFASRAGEKLEYAINEFHIDITNKICADFGASVGGFVDCLLHHGASKVYAVETGYGELAWKLRNNPQVVVMERTNAMHVLLPEKMNVITNDTSWTRQKNIFPNILNNLKQDGIIITLIKPHYEAGQGSWKDKKLLHKGVLTEDIAQTVAQQTLDDIIKEFNLDCNGFIKSPILGGKGGNSEYLAYLARK